MDAVKFIKERDRMCRFYHHAGDCYQCPAKDCECSALEGMVDDDNIVTIVKEWSAAHPRKTRQSVFLERWPAARLDERGVLAILPCLMNPIQYRTPEDTCATGMMCMDCRKKYWMQEVE